MSLMELMYLEEYYENDKINHSLNSKIYPLVNPEFSTSKISKSDFAKHYQFLCKECGDVPIIKIFKRNIIKYICKCEESPRELTFQDIYKYILYSEEIDFYTYKLKCTSHSDEKYIYYCEKCKKNLCKKCIENCIEHEDKLKSLFLDRNIIKIVKYIKEIIDKQTSTYIDEDDSKNFSINDVTTSNNELFQKKQIKSSEKEFNNKTDNEGGFFLIKKEDNINLNKEDFINLMDEDNSINITNINYEEYITIELFSIIIYESQNYPNYNFFETITNLEKIATLYFGDYNEITLKYEFNEENIKYDSFQFFGEVFVNNNNENCFLIINEKIFGLNQYIKLSEIFDINKEVKNWPIHIEVKLIEPKNKLMNNMSNMFYEISTLLPISDFNNFNTNNITKMSYMFYNCSSLTQLPDISKFNTKNVIDMSYMFYNCSSLTELPDISKFDTKNVNDMSYMFYNCSSIISLPDISKWNMENISYINSMFCNCESLISIPDICKWNLNNNKIKSMKNLFKNCKMLSNVQILSKWEIGKEHFSYDMFEGCKFLVLISKKKIM